MVKGIVYAMNMIICVAVIGIHNNFDGLNFKLGGVNVMKGELDWIKVNVNSFDDNKIRIISSMPQGDSIICIWFRLLFEAGKNNDDGYVYINEVIPYTCEMLSKLFDRPVKKVQHALKVLKDFMMIEIDDDNFIKIKNWSKYQSVDKLDAIRESGKERTRRCRAKKKAEAEKAKLMEESKLKENSNVNEAVINNEDINVINNRSYSSVNKFEDDFNKSINEIEYGVCNPHENINGYEDNIKSTDFSEVNYSYNNEAIAEVAAGDMSTDYNLKEEDYPDELKFNYGNGDCNVTCNSENVTVTDKIKNKKEIKNRDREEDREGDKKQDKNNNLKSSSNVTSNPENCYTVTQGETSNKRYATDMSNADIINSNGMSSMDNHTSISNGDSLNNSSAKDLDTVINKILATGSNIKSIEIACVMQKFYSEYSDNKEWISIDEIRWMLIEHDYKYVKSAIEIAIAARTFDCSYVNRILAKWKEDKYPKCI